MVETLVQGRWRYSHHGFRRIKICSFPRLGSSFLSRRISFRISGCHCFVRRTSGPLLRGISASGPPVLSNRRHQYRVRVDTPKASATALIPCFSQKCSAFILNLAISGNRVFHRIDGCTIIPKIVVLQPPQLKNSASHGAHNEKGMMILIPFYAELITPSGQVECRLINSRR